ncbi:MAG TPA: response regulator transcription factor [Alphaproteobacteria bacterium]
MSASEREPNAKREGPATAIRIAIGDDHPLALLGLRALIEAVPDLEIVGEASDGRAILDIIKTSTPDIALIDVPMPQLRVSDLTRDVHQHSPGTRILVLTNRRDSDALRDLLQLGAEGYVLKRSAPAELVRAIRTVMSGRGYIDPTIASTVLFRRTAGDSPAAAALSNREVAVLRLVAQGFGNKEMAAELNLSIKTIQTYKMRAMKKLSLRTRADIVRYGAARGWIENI